MANLVTKQSISQELAQKLLNEAELKAQELGIPASIAICDESGILKVFARMDGAALMSIELAIKKAKTSVGFGLSTSDLFNFIKNDPPLCMGAPHIDDLVVFGGGHPIKVGDQIVGGIGVSGGHYSYDIQCVEKALELLESAV